MNESLTVSKVVSRLVGQSDASVEGIFEFEGIDQPKGFEDEVYKVCDRCSGCDIWERLTQLVPDDSTGYWCQQCCEERKGRGSFHKRWRKKVGL